VSGKVTAAAVLALALATAACGGKAGPASAASGSLRLGYFPNLTHATAIVGVEKGFFAEHLGSTGLDTKTFNAGGDAVSALFAGGLDAAYLGPSPTINAWTQSNGEAIRIVAGATSGGAFLVVDPDVGSPDALKGRTLASPQLGNTQDVALRAWLKSKGLRTDLQGGGDVEIKPQENAQTLDTFKAGSIDGAWVPEPWATRLVQEGGGKVLVMEADLWPNGRYVTTQLVVRTKYLEEHPDVLKALLEGDLEADAYLHDHTEEAKKVVNGGIKKATGKSLADAVLDAAWKNLAFTVDPVATSLAKSASDAYALGLLKRKPDLTGIYDLAPLNALLTADGREEVRGL
jgi:NitT/TauT family transport system substrate-binding protein